MKNKKYNHEYKIKESPYLSDEQRYSKNNSNNNIIYVIILILTILIIKINISSIFQKKDIKFQNEIKEYIKIVNDNQDYKKYLINLISKTTTTKAKLEIEVIELEYQYELLKMTSPPKYFEKSHQLLLEVNKTLLQYLKKLINENINDITLAKKYNNTNKEFVKEISVSMKKIQSKF